MSSTIRIQHADLRMTRYAEGGELMEQYVHGIGWVVANELEPTSDMRAAADAQEVLKALEETIDSVAILATGRCPQDLVRERLDLLTAARAVLLKAKGV